MAPCPPTPNCVSSDATDAAHLVTAFQLAVPSTDGWRTARAAVANLPRTRIVSETDEYLHAECSSAVFGFVDDIGASLASGSRHNRCCARRRVSAIAILA